MPSPGAESIGSMFSGIGIFSAAIYPQFVYILWIAKPCATISPVGKSDSQNSTPRPHPSLGKLAQAGFPLFPGMPLGALRPEPRYELGDAHLAVVLAEDVLGGVPNHLCLGSAPLRPPVQGDRAADPPLRAPL